MAVVTPLPPPHLRKCGTHYRRDDYFVGVAMREAERLLDYCDLTLESMVLDLGCGVGRLAIGMNEVLGSLPAYIGFDVDAKAIAWATENLGPLACEFRCVDIRNARYNAKGAVEINDSFRLPYADGAFDIVYAYSLFTHLTLAHARVYLREIGRVLAPGGTAFLTAFVEPGVSDEEENPPHYPPKYRNKHMGPLHRVRFSEDAWIREVADAGLRIEKFHHQAEWNHQSAFYLARDHR